MPARRERTRDAEPDAAGRAGDDGRLAGKLGRRPRGRLSLIDPLLHFVFSDTLDARTPEKEGWSVIALEEGEGVSTRGKPHTPAVWGNAHIACGSSLSWNRSADSSTTVSLPVFFHQWEVPFTSAVDLPARCTIGSAQVLRYSVILPLMM